MAGNLESTTMRSFTMNRLLVLAATLAALATPAAPTASSGAKGGSLLSGKLSIAAEWGASFATQAPIGGLPGLPLYVGGTFTVWLVEWFLMDAHASYSFNNQRTAVLTGPRFRTWTYPIAGSIGLRAGLIGERNTGVRFGLSPYAAVDMIFNRHFLAALEGCVDVPVGGNGASVRVGLMLGWRF